MPARWEAFTDTKHAIYAYLDTGVRVRVSPAMTYDAACRVFYGPADLGAGGIARREAVYVGDYIGRVKHFCVRSVTDPNWPAAQPPHDVETRTERVARLRAAIAAHTFDLPPDECVRCGASPMEDQDPRADWCECA